MGDPTLLGRTFLFSILIFSFLPWDSRKKDQETEKEKKPDVRIPQTPGW